MDRIGLPLSAERTRGIPPVRARCIHYAAGSMPLAVTQEDSLVNFVEFSKENCWPVQTAYWFISGPYTNFYAERKGEGSQ